MTDDVATGDGQGSDTVVADARDGSPCRPCRRALPRAGPGLAASVAGRGTSAAALPPDLPFDVARKGSRIGSPPPHPWTLVPVE